MGVVFDEVVTQVEAPPQPREVQQDRGGAEQAPQSEARRWQQHQADFRRRQQRLEAD